MLYTEAVDRNFDEMLEGAIDRLQSNTNVTNFSAGSIARALLEVYYDDLEKLHEKLS